MKIRKTLTVIVGILQSIIAVLTLIFACILYFNFFGIYTWLNTAVEFSYVHLLALFVFVFLSIISGVLLIQEWLESR